MKNAITRRQRAVIPAMLTGLSLQEVSRRTGVSDATLSRWLTEPDFCDVLDAALDQQLKDAVTKAAGVNLSEILPGTLASIKEIIQNPRTKVRAKLAAIKLSWDIVFRLEQLKRKCHD